MMLAILRISSPTLDPWALLARHPDLAAESVWQAGETGLRGRVHESSGFTLDLGSDSHWPRLLERTLGSLEGLRQMLDDARAYGADLTLDFGLVVGLAEAFTRAVAFTPTDFRRLLDLGVTVVVSAYPGHE